MNFPQKKLSSVLGTNSLDFQGCKLGMVGPTRGKLVGVAGLGFLKSLLISLEFHGPKPVPFTGWSRESAWKPREGSGCYRGRQICMTHKAIKDLILKRLYKQWGKIGRISSTHDLIFRFWWSPFRWFQKEIFFDVPFFHFFFPTLVFSKIFVCWLTLGKENRQSAWQKNGSLTSDSTDFRWSFVRVPVLKGKDVHKQQLPKSTLRTTVLPSDSLINMLFITFRF